FREEIVQIAPAGDVVEVRQESLTRRLEIEAVEAGVVEEVAFDAPDFVIHLLPLGARIDAHLDVVELEQTVAGLGRGGGIDDVPLVGALTIKQLFAVGGYIDATDVIDERLRLALG